MKFASDICVGTLIYAMCEGSDIHYLSGFVGVCLINYFYRRQPSTAFAVLLRLLNWKIDFTQTLCRILKAVDVVEMAVLVSCT